MRHERKRKRGRRRDDDDGDREEEERLRLVRTLSTSIRRAGKVARAHETTRTVRRLKERREALDRLEKAKGGSGGVEGDGNEGEFDRAARPPAGDGGDNDGGRDEGDLKRAIRRARRRVSSLERRLDLVKRFEVDVLVGVCMRRLGLAGVGVDVDAVVASMGSSRPRPGGGQRRGPQQVQRQKQVVDGDGEEEDDEEEAKCNDGETEPPREASAEEIELVESMLLHKKLSSTMDSLNERVTEYRRTLMRRKDGEGDDVDDLGRDGSNGRTRGRRQHTAVGRENWSRKATATSGSGSLFVGSLSGGAEDEEPNGDEGAGGDDYFRYGPGAVLDDYADVVQPKKKNRKGQRARRAKAMAEEARRQGKRWDSSINWREKKKGKKGRLPNDADGGDGVDRSAEASSASGLRAKADVKASEVAEMGKSWKEEGKAHPSWAAKQHAKQQTGIVKFAGKKITFD